MDLLDAGWDPYRRNHYGCSSIYYALSGDRLRPYILAQGLDLEHLTMPIERPSVVVHIVCTAGLCGFLRRFPKAARSQCLNQLHGHELIPLVNDSVHARTDRMDVLIKAGVDIEVCNGDVCTALNAASLAGQLTSVVFLVRDGAELECSRVGCRKNALRTASKTSALSTGAWWGGLLISARSHMRPLAGTKMQTSAPGLEFDRSRSRCKVALKDLLGSLAWSTLFNFMAGKRGGGRSYHWMPLLILRLLLKRDSQTRGQFLRLVRNGCVLCGRIVA